MQKTVDVKIAVIQDAEEDTLSSLPRIKANLCLLKDVVSNTTKELDSICKQIIEEELTERDVNILLEEATQMVDSSREVASGLRARLLEAAAAIEEEEPKEEPPNTLEGSRAKLLEAVVALDEETARKDPPKLILNDAMELDTLQNLKKSLKRFLTRLSIGRVQDLVSWPDMFLDIPESVIT